MGRSARYAKMQHFRRRVFERFGMDIDPGKVIRSVFKREGLPIRYEGDDALYFMVIDGQKMVVVFDRKHITPVTAMRHKHFKSEIAAAVRG